jgi:hypothetical protein
MLMNVSVYAKQYEWEDVPRYHFFTDGDGARKSLEAQEYVYICAVDVEIQELSSGEFTARQIHSLRMKQDALRETFVDQSAKLNDRIQNLLAITD